MTIQEKAKELFDAMEQRTRPDKGKYYCLKQDSPQWMTKVIHKAHGFRATDTGGSKEMTTLYGFKNYETQRANGLHLVKDNERLNLVKREKGVALKVGETPQGNGGRVPSIRVAGKWLSGFGFEVGDTVILVASQGKIEIIGKEGSYVS